MFASNMSALNQRVWSAIVAQSCLLQTPWHLVILRLIFLHCTDNPYSVYGVARPSQLTHLSQTSIQSARAGKLRTKTSSSKPLTVNLSHTTRRALPQRPAIGPQGSNIYSVPTSEHSLYAPAGVYSSIYTTGPQQQQIGRASCRERV